MWRMATGAILVVGFKQQTLIFWKKVVDVISKKWEWTNQNGCLSKFLATSQQPLASVWEFLSEPSVWCEHIFSEPLTSTPASTLMDLHGSPRVRPWSIETDADGLAIWDLFFLAPPADRQICIKWNHQRWLELLAIPILQVWHHKEHVDSNHEFLAC